MYYNVHTHRSKTSPVSIEIENILVDFQSITETGKVSMGLHPRYLQTENWHMEYAELEQNVTRKEVLAVGECGLDRLCNVDFTLQKLVFKHQIDLAGNLKKPLIIHCVKAFSDVLEMVKDFAQPVIFHGVNNKLAIIKPIIDKGYYLSFGKSLMSSNEAIQMAFRETPLEQVFLETDDMDIDIAEIYKMAATIKNIDEKEIVLQLERNFLTVFGA